MIPKDLFGSVGKFDLRYSSAYHEDTGLTFQVRDQGHRVLCQPLSKVIYYERLPSRCRSSRWADHKRLGVAVVATSLYNALR